MTVQAVSGVDYATGSQYSYEGTTGKWTSIQALGGSVNGNAGGSFDNTASHVVSSNPSASASAFSLVSSAAPVSKHSLPTLRTKWVAPLDHEY